MPFHVYGWSVQADGSIVELALFSRESAHTTGSYALPSLSVGEPETTVVNVGDEEAEIVGQIAWQGGAYAFGPEVVAAGASLRISPRSLAERGNPDLMGRTLDPDYEGATLRWVSRGPSHALIARTELLVEGSADRFGMNCKSCCESIPVGHILPGLAQFPLGQSHPFQAAVSYIQCDGTMGPYAVTPDVFHTPSALLWNGSEISGVSATDDDVAFEEQVQVINWLCRLIWRLVLGRGRAELCQKTFNPNNYDPAKTCVEQTVGCSECNTCCEDVYKEKVCRGRRPDLALGERNACVGLCTTGPCL